MKADRLGKSVVKRAIAVSVGWKVCEEYDRNRVRLATHC